MREYVCDCNIIHEDVVNTTKKKINDIDIFSDVSNFFKVIGDLTRIKILYALDNNEMCVCDIASTLNMSNSLISHQLKVLKDNKIVKYRKQGKEVYYLLVDDHVKDIIDIAFCHINHKR